MSLLGGEAALALAAESGILYSIRESNLAGQLILLILLIGSLFSWSVMITKFSMVSRIRQETARFMRRFRDTRMPLAMYFKKADQYPGSPSWHVYRAGCRELMYQLHGVTEPEESDRVMMSDNDRVSPVAMGIVRSAVEREVGEQALRMEHRMILLATAVSGGPFLGLLGTVWGVMDTFADVAATGKADLVTMAPGMAGAMLTTVTGLLVAIPAMFGYNYLVTSIRSLTVELDNFAAEMVAAFEHKFLDTR
jgi:biopolymer transport protein ExbB/TolQ